MGVYSKSFHDSNKCERLGSECDEVKVNWFGEERYARVVNSYVASQFMCDVIKNKFVCVS